MNREFKTLKLQWLPTIDGSHCICLIHADRLLRWKP
jgi:hypothetical protein